MKLVQYILLMQFLFKRLLVSFAVHAGDTVETHERAEQKLKISNEAISSWVS